MKIYYSTQPLLYKTTSNWRKELKAANVMSTYSFADFLFSFMYIYKFSDSGSEFVKVQEKRFSRVIIVKIIKLLDFNKV